MFSANNTINSVSWKPFPYEKITTPLTEIDDDEFFASLFNDKEHKGKIGGFHFRRIFNNLAIQWVSEYYYPLTKTTANILFLDEVSKISTSSSIKKFSISKKNKPLLKAGFITLDDSNEFYTLSKKEGATAIYLSGESCGAIISIATYQKIIQDYGSHFSLDTLSDIISQLELLKNAFLMPLHETDRDFLELAFQL